MKKPGQKLWFFIAINDYEKPFELIGSLPKNCQIYFWQFFYFSILDWFCLLCPLQGCTLIVL